MTRYLPPPGPSRPLAVAQLTDSIGLGGYLVCSALYFTRIVDLSPTQVGFGLTAGWAVGFLTGVPLGHLADRRGPRGIAILLALCTAAALVLFLFVRDFVPFVLVACLYSTALCGLNAARQALLAGLVPAQERTKVRAVLAAAINAGIAVGAGFGGLALQADTEVAYLAVFAVDAVSLVVSALVLLRLPVVAPTPATAHGEPALAVLRDRPYAVVSALNMVLQLHIPLITLAIPLWIVARTNAPGWTVSLLLVLNTVSVVLFQVRVANKVTNLASALRFMRFAGVTLLAACVVFALSGFGAPAWAAVGVLVVAAGLQAAAEMMQASGAWEISFGLAPEGRHGQYQGFFGSGFTVARMLGPLLVTTVVLGWGTAGWLLLGAVFVTAGAAMGPAVRWAERTRRGRVETQPLLTTTG
ncbi:MFS transporter [Actinophytocola algeriensis]|uniref:MFS family permease n=1 Tax=Actinophytocola algeriensis TaxID=1768010 RepID=A0A7W7Q955_9PSEU|nr:MFS transporter [Actinophytocola algeriensis]MBB4909277.1 MFS family permease [Actinophytocola algeriensis]MBE1474335.1 MFS family permease [Actinophytocola algeriensis]